HCSAGESSPSSGILASRLLRALGSSHLAPSGARGRSRPPGRGVMPNAFPTTPRAARDVRIAATAIAVAAVVLAIRTTLTSTDWMLLFGAFLLSGMAYLACGLVVWVLRPDGPLGATFLGMGASWAFFLLTAMDLYGPATFFRLHVLCETLVPPSVLQLALLFP